MYHSRELLRSSLPQPQTNEKLKEIQNYVRYWDGSSTVGERAVSVDKACADVIVFMEHIPQTAFKWLREENSHGRLNEQALTKLDHELHSVIAFMKSQGFLHFDANFDNLLMNKGHVYFADFGLVTSQAFDLSQEEKAFFNEHKDYDHYSVVSDLAMRTIIATVGENESIIMRDKYFSAENMAVELPEAVSKLAMRYRPIAILMNTFFEGLVNTSKSTPYPRMQLEREWAKLEL